MERLHSGAVGSSVIEQQEHLKCKSLCVLWQPVQDLSNSSFNCWDRLQPTPITLPNLQPWTRLSRYRIIERFLTKRTLVE